MNRTANVFHPTRLRREKKRKVNRTKREHGTFIKVCLIIAGVLCFVYLLIY